MKDTREVRTDVSTEELLGEYVRTSRTRGSISVRIVPVCRRPRNVETV